MRNFILWLTSLFLLYEANAEPFTISTDRENQHISFTGQLDAESVDALISKIQDNPEINILRIESEGGEVTNAIKLATFLYKRNISLIVNTYCNSSCANYIMPAAKYKFLSNKSIVAFHGGAKDLLLYDPLELIPTNTPVEQIEVMVKSHYEYSSKAIEKEERLYQLLNVSSETPYLGREFSKQYAKKHVDPTVKGWSYSLEILNKLNIKNIYIIGGDWQPEVFPNAHFPQLNEFPNKIKSE